ncbi:MAG: DUF2141 domain-containing protein [Desulfobacterales bacterium]|nr:DUF2141 domain-containing protein [Desulfobacterales bacterium]
MPCGRVCRGRRGTACSGRRLPRGPGRHPLRLCGGRKGFAVPNTGLREARLRVGPAEAAAGRVHFLFNLPAGRYGVRCFLDLNGNGRLDKGPFGPTEPWGMSWNGARRAGFPKFGDIAFRVDRDTRELGIEVK